MAALATAIQHPRSSDCQVCRGLHSPGCGFMKWQPQQARIRDFFAGVPDDLILVIAQKGKNTRPIWYSRQALTHRRAQLQLRVLLAEVSDIAFIRKRRHSQKLAQEAAQ